MAEDQGENLSSADALVKVMGTYGHHMTAFEADIWKGIIKSVPEERFKGFLSYHLASSPYKPLPHDANKALGLLPDSAMSFETLKQLVRSCGPYQVPPITDPVLITTVQLLGGWPDVNATLPDDSKEGAHHAVRAFRERFDGCFNQAMRLVLVNKQLPSQPLVAIGHTAALAAQLSYRADSGREHAEGRA